jgi:hypothetical protein
MVAALSRNPNLGVTTRVVRVSSVLPLPPETAGLGRVVTEHPAVECLDDTPVL